MVVEAGISVVKVSTPIEVTVVWSEITTVGANIVISVVIVCAGAVKMAPGMTSVVILVSV